MAESIQREIKKNRPKIAPSDIDYENAHLLFELMKVNFALTKKPNFEKWANVFRLLRADYGNDQDDFVKYVIRWSQQDDFWKKNIRSAEKFRKQYETLYLGAKGEVERQNKRVVTIGGKHDFEALKERLRSEEN